MRFDEVELQSVPFPDAAIDRDTATAGISAGDEVGAPLTRRFLSVATDLSLFAALALALTPLLPASRSWEAVGCLAGFVVVLSYYYFVGAWLLWGKTVGGAIFDVRVIATDDTAMSLSSASARWIGVCASLLTCGTGFALAVLPGRRSLPDRLSDTRCITG